MRPSVQLKSSPSDELHRHSELPNYLATGMLVMAVTKRDRNACSNRPKSRIYLGIPFGFLFDFGLFSVARLATCSNVNLNV